MAGSKKLQQGEMTVLGGDIGDVRHRRDVCPRIAYMPQGLGKNLYLELSVYDNVDFMAQLFGLSTRRSARAASSNCSTPPDSARFRDRPAGKLSGGMKQKVGLCGALVHDPDLLILDEPTTGVDPLSRRQFWTLIDDIRAGRPSMSVVVATAYMDEAQQWDWIVAMDDGQGARHRHARGADAAHRHEGPGEVLHRAAAGGEAPGAHGAGDPAAADGQAEIAIDAKDLTRRFGNFTAVDRVTLAIERGEIFGFLGSQRLRQVDDDEDADRPAAADRGHRRRCSASSVEADSMEVRENLGYMTQAFSLYGEMTIRQNLVLHARLYHLPPEKAKARIDGAGASGSGSRPHLDALAEDLPMGLRQRLSLAVAVLHEPQILILDEPTSGVDPVARDSFWELLIDLSRNQGVTIFVTTHFMNEGMRCDRISLMNAGKVLACDAPQKLIDERGAASLEEAFIGYMEDSAGEIVKQTAAMKGGAAGGAKEQEPEKEKAPGAPLKLEPAGHGRQSKLALVHDPDARLHAQRDRCRSCATGPAGVRVPRLGAADVRLRLRHHHRRRGHPLRDARSGPARRRAVPTSSSSRRSPRYFTPHAAGQLGGGGARAAASGRSLDDPRDPAQLRPRPAPGLRARRSWPRSTAP